MQQFHLAIISTNRWHNVEFMQTMCEPFTCHWYVDIGEYERYSNAGADVVVECGLDICAARNQAIIDADKLGLPCVQISDDLRNIKLLSAQPNGKILNKFTDVEYVISTLIRSCRAMNIYYGGVAISSNPLNFKNDGKEISFDKLIVNDLICLMPGAGLFDETLALKEDYDMSIRHLLGNGVLRLNNILCDFPHRQNKGGANDYRNDTTEADATQKLIAKWPDFVRMNPRRPGQVLLNYKAIREYKNNTQKQKLFDI